MNRFLERRIFDVKILVRVLLSISLSFACLFLCVGYASISDSLDIYGNVTALAAEKPLTGVYITEVTEVSTTNIDKNEFSFMTGTTNLSNSVSRGMGGDEGVIVYDVTVPKQL